jgi:hypothetical protein
MINQVGRVLASAVFFTASFLLSVPALAQRTCESLNSFTPPNTAITAGTSVPAGPFTPPPDVMGNAPTENVPAFCRVSGDIKPTPDSDIKFEVWMPATSWNGKFLDVGNGGYAGFINYRSMLMALKRGYATASTDDGHTGMLDVTWAIGHPEKMIDFGYRAVHETAEKARAIIRAFYGKDAARSYFNGCSDGGREALMEAQRFPNDFDGIIVGAPANFWTHQFAGFIWNEQATLNDPASYIPPAKLPVIQAAALAQCSKLDGAADGTLEDPRQCHFEPAKIQCSGADGTNCLTAPQVEAARRIYSGPAESQGGKTSYPGYEPGAEADPENWKVWITGATPGTAVQFFFGNSFFADMVFENPKWSFKSFDLDKDLKFADEKLGRVLNSVSPDLGDFQKRGGKLIQYHGWADAAVAPVASIDYYNTVVAVERERAPTKKDAAAMERTQSFYRLFMVPGMDHCTGGPGANIFGNHPAIEPPNIDAEHDLVSALDRWVEHGTAPEQFIATKYVDDKREKGIVRTHLLCPYPKVAKWTGKGNSSDATSYLCEAPSAVKH